MTQTSMPQARQIDFFATLDAFVPSEDVIIFTGEYYSPEVRFDPKLRNQFDMYDYIAQMTAVVHFDNDGRISTIDIERFGGEAGDIEPSFRAKFKLDAEQFIANHARGVGVYSSH